MHNPIKNWRRQQTIKGSLGKRGTVIASTIVYVGNVELQKQTPYPVAMVELEDGERLYGQLVDCDPAEVVPGLKVVSVLRVVSGGAVPEDVISYGLKFRPVK
jgi:uncharacterized OB-fold protein